MTEKLKTLKEEFKDLTQKANMDLEGWDIRTKPSMEGLKKKSKIELESVKRELSSTLLREAFAVLFLSDFNSDELSNKVMELSPNDTLSFDFDALEKTLVDFIFPREVKVLSFNTEFIRRLNTALITMGQQLQFASMPSVKQTGFQGRALKDKADAVEMVKKLIEETYGDDFKYNYMAHEIFHSFSTKLDQDNIVVLVKNVPEDEMNVLYKIFNAKRCVPTTTLTNNPQYLQIDDKMTGKKFQQTLNAFLSKKNKGEE